MSEEDDLGRTEIMRQIQGAATEELGLLILDKEPTTDQSKETTKVHIGIPRNCIGVTYSKMDDGFLTEAEMKRQRGAGEATGPMPALPSCCGHLCLCTVLSLHAHKTSDFW